MRTLLGGAIIAVAVLFFYIISLPGETPTAIIYIHTSEREHAKYTFPDTTYRVENITRIESGRGQLLISNGKVIGYEDGILRQTKIFRTALQQ